jgi:autotransporter-associated beta strand protein
MNSRIIRGFLVTSLACGVSLSAQAAPVDVPRNWTIVSVEATTGSVALTKTGAGTLSLIGSEGNTFSGDIVVDTDAGTLKIGGILGATGPAAQGVAFPGMTSANSLTVKRNGTFYIEDNAMATVAGYLGNRLGTDGNRPNLTLAGGALYFNGANVAAVTTQSVGVLTLDPGPSAITIVRAAGTPQLVFSSLAAAKGSYVTFTGVSLGTNTVNVPQILFTTPPSNVVGGAGAPGSKTMSIVTGARLGNDLVYYGAYGLRAVVTGEYNDVAGNDINLAGATENVRIIGATPVTLPALTAPRTVNSLILLTGAAAIWPMADTLTLTSGQLLSTPSVARTIPSGTLTAGSGGAAELAITILGTGSIGFGGLINDNGPTGAVTVVKNGTGTLTLSNVTDSAYSGGTIVNEGTLTLVGVATNRRFFGTGPVVVDNAILNLTAIGATANGAGPDYTAVQGAQIAIPATLAQPADDTFSIGPLSVLNGAGLADLGLNSLDRGIGGESAVTNVVLAEDAIIGHPALTGPLNLLTGTIKNLGTAADLYYGIGVAHASPTGTLGIGNGTAFKGISTIRTLGAFSLGTLEVGAGTSDIYFQGLAVPGALPVVLTVGNLLAVGGPVVQLADADTTVNANILGAVTIDDDAAVFGDTTAGKLLKFVVKPGATLTFNQAGGMGSGTGIASVEVQSGGTLAIANPAALNGAVTVKAGGRLLCSQASGLIGTGALTFEKGAIIQVTVATGFSGPQADAATIDPGVIVRMGIAAGSPVDTLDAHLAARAPVYETYGGVFFPVNPVAAGTTIMTLNKDAATGEGGLLVNDNLSRAIVAVPNGVIVIGTNGGTIAATTNTILTMPQAIALGTNTLTIGSTNRIDEAQLPKQGAVYLSALKGQNTALPGGRIVVAPGATLGNGAVLNALPEIADITVDGTLLLGAAQTIGSLDGSGVVSLPVVANALTVGRNNKSTVFSGSLAGGGAIYKTGSGRLDLTSYVTNSSLFTVNAGTLALSGAGQTTNTGTTAYTLIGDGTLLLDNTDVNMGNRLAGSAPGITFQGGVFRFIGKDGEASSETLGVPTLTSGRATIDVVNGTNTGSSAQLTFGAPVLTAGFLNFTAPNGTLGMAGNNPRVLFTSGVATGFVGFATVGSAPAYYEAATGIRAFNLAEGTEFDGTAAQALTLNTIFTTANNDLPLTAARAVNSLWINNPGLNQVLDLGSSGLFTLKLASGRITLTGTDSFEIKRSGTSTASLANNTSNGKMYFGVDDAGTTLTLSAPIAASTGTIEKDGAGTLVLNATNLFTTGGLTINAGTVKYGQAGDLAATMPLNVLGGGALDFNGISDTIAAVNLFQGGITNSGSGGVLTVGALALGSGPAGSSAYIDSGSGVLKLSSTIAYNIVNDPDKAFLAGNLDLNGALRVFTVGNSVAPGAAVDLEISAVVTGGVGFGISKAGVGVMKLSGANTHDGILTNTAGTVILANSQALGLPSVARNATVASGATLALDGVGISDPNDRLTLSLNGAGDTLIGPVSGALLNLAGTNAVPSKILLAAASQIASLGGKLMLGGNITASVAALALTVAGDGDTELDGVLGTTTGTLIKNGAGTLTLGGPNGNTFTGATTVNGGTLVLDKAADSAIPSGLVTVNSGGLLQYAPLSANTNQIGTAAVTLNGTGRLDLNGAVDTITNVVIAAAGATADTTPVLNTAGGGNLSIGSLTITPTPGYVSRLDTGTGQLTLGGNLTFTAATTGRARIGGNLNLGAATRSLTFTAGTGPDNDLEIDAVIDGGPGAGIAMTLGRLRLNAANAYSGDTTITSGLLKLGHLNAIPSGAGKGNLYVTGTLDLNGFSPTCNALLGGAGSITSSAPGNLMLTVGLNNSTGTFAGIIRDIDGDLALTKIGTGTQILSGANQYLGPTLIKEGTLRSGVASSLATGPVIVDGGIWDVATFADSVGAVILTNGSIVGTSGAITSTDGFTFENGTVSAILAGVTNLWKVSPGTVTLSGVNTFTGPARVLAGTLRATTAATALGAGVSPLHLSDGVVLQLANDTPLAFARNTTVYGDVRIESDRVTPGFGVTNSLGTLLIASNTLTVTGGENVLGGSPGVAFAGAISMMGNPIFAVETNGTGADMFLGVGGLNDNGIPRTIVKTGPGLMNLSAVAVMMLNGSRIEVAAGRLHAAAAGALGTQANVDLADGTLFSLGAAQTIGALSSSNGVNNDSRVWLGGFGLTAGNNNSTFAFPGEISGTGSLAKAGTGKWTLSGANTYTGLTTVSAGTLAVRHPFALGVTNFGTTVALGATLEIQGGIETLPEPLSLNGTGVGAAGALRNVADDNIYAGLMSLAGATRIQSDAGVLTLNHPGTVSGAFGLTVGGAGDVILHSVLATGIGTLTKADSGMLTLTAANTYSGATTVNGGRLFLFNPAGSATGSGAITVNAGGDLAGVGSSTGAVTCASGGSLTPGQTGIAGGQLTVGKLTLQAGSVVNVDFGPAANDIIVVTTNIAGLTLNGVGFNLTDESTGYPFGSNGTYNLIQYSGVLGGSVDGLTVLNPIPGKKYSFRALNGWLKVVIGGADGMWNGADPDDSNWQSGLNWSSGVAPEPFASLIFAGTERMDNTNDFAVDTGFNNLLFDETAGPFTLDGNRLLLFGNVTNYSVQPQVVNLPLLFSDGTRTVNTLAGDITLNGVLEDGDQTNGLMKLGVGTLTLSAGNTYDGQTTVSNGMLSIRHSNALGSSVGSLAISTNAGTLRLSGGITIVSEALYLAGILRNGADDNIYSGPITLGLGARVISDSGTLLLNPEAPITGAFALSFSGSGTTRVATAINTGAATLTKDGSGTLILESTNNYSGMTTLNGGTVKVEVDNALAGGALTINANSIYDLGSYTDTVGMVSMPGANSRIAGSGTLYSSVLFDFKNAGQYTTNYVDVVLAGTAGLNHGGDWEAATILNNTNTYTGPTTINSGRYLVVNNLANGGLPSGIGASSSLENNLRLSGQLVYTGPSVETDRNMVISAGCRLYGANGYWERSDYDTGFIWVTDPETVLTLNGVLNSITNYGAVNAIPASFFQKLGPGTLVLANTNLYVGYTDVVEGTLRVTGSINDSNFFWVTTYPVQVESNAVLSGSGLIKPVVQVDDMGRIAPGHDLPVGTTLTVGGLTLLSGGEAAFEFSASPTNDTIDVLGSSRLAFEDARILLFEDGTTNAWTTPGTYKLIRFNGSIVGGGPALLRVGNPAAGLTYTFVAEDNWVSVTIDGGVKWDGGGGDDNWTTAENWESDTAPDLDDVVTFSGNLRTASFNDFPATRFGGILFDRDASEFNLEGNTFNLSGNIVNESLYQQVFVMPIVLDGRDSIISASSNDFAFYSTIDDGGNGHGIVKTGAGTVTLYAGNTYGGPTEIRMGTLRLGTSDALPDGAGKGLVSFTPGSIALSRTGYEVGDETLLMGNGVLDMAGNSDTINGMVGSGVISNSSGSALLTVDVASGGMTSLVRFVESDGTLALAKSGAGILALTLPAHYTGGTVVNAGELRLLNTIGSATGPGGISVAADAALGGTGIARGGLLSLAAQAIVRPGVGGTGTLSVDDLAWENQAVLHCEVTDISGAGYGSLAVNGTLAPAAPGDKLQVRLDTLGQTMSVPSGQSISLRVMTFPNGTIDLADFELNTNDFLVDGTWSLTNIGHSLYARCEGASGVDTWIGSGAWEDATNWSRGVIPQPGDTVVFDSTSVNPCTAGFNSIPDFLESITLDTGYTGRVLVEKLAVAGGMELTLSGDLTLNQGEMIMEGNPNAVGAGTDDNPYGEGYSIAAQNIVVAPGASLNADDRGFGPLSGPGRAKGNLIILYTEYDPMSGASHGGYGGTRSTNHTTLPAARYGTVTGPTELGSGGFMSSGGGALKLAAAGTVTVNGTLSASCTNKFGTGASGGSIWIAAGVLEGTGAIMANGATCTNGAGGGGGRIDLSGSTNNFAGLIEVRGGTGSVHTLTYLTQRIAWPGSIMFPQSAGTGLTLDSFVPYTNIALGNSLTCGTVIVSNVTMRLQAYEDDTVLTCDSLFVQSNGHLRCEGDYYASNEESGGSAQSRHGRGVTIAAGDITIDEGCSINADSAGFLSSKSNPTLGPWLSGPGGARVNHFTTASHGGQGGLNGAQGYDINARAVMYGTAAGPTALGSAGNGDLTSGPGGGAIKLVVNNTITVNGRLSADAVWLGSSYSQAAGGSIWIASGTLEGTGQISAKGGPEGAAVRGGGAGGRIDISGTVNNFAGDIGAWGGSLSYLASPVVRGQTGSLLLPAASGSSGAIMSDFRPYGTNFVFGNSLAFGDCVITNGVVLTLDANEGSNVFTFSSLTIGAGGTLRCLGNATAVNPEAGGTTSRLYGAGVTIVATNLVIEPGGLLTADGQGHLVYSFVPINPGISNSYAGLGGGYSGKSYGALSNVTALGSGLSVQGGGAIRLIVPETLTVDGEISCDGYATTNTTGGSGGSIWIDCDTLAGIGAITADGSGGTNSIGGGGGRVYLAYNVLGANNPLENVSVNGGGSNETLRGSGGTLFVHDRGEGDALGRLTTGNDRPALNSTTPLPDQDQAFSRIRIRENGSFLLPQNRVLAVTESLSNAASFLAETGSVVTLTGPADKAIYGSTVFDTLVIDAEPQTVRFEKGSLSTVIRSLVFNEATLLSSEAGVPWRLDLVSGATQDVRRVSVQDSDARAGMTIYVTDRSSHNLGGNANWRFPPNGVIIVVR